jgi:isopenicillin N synthase-like dioxygenase
MSASRISQLPIIDLAPLLNDDPVDHDKRVATSEALHRACVQFGFFYLNIEAFADPKEPGELAELGREFFSRPQEEKDIIALKNQDGARGNATHCMLANVGILFALCRVAALTIVHILRLCSTERECDKRQSRQP